MLPRGIGVGGGGRPGGRWYRRLRDSRRARGGTPRLEWLRLEDPIRFLYLLMANGLEVNAERTHLSHTKPPYHLVQGGQYQDQPVWIPSVNRSWRSGRGDGNLRVDVTP